MRDCEGKFEQLSDDQKLSKRCSDAGLKIVEIRQFFFTLDTEEGPNEKEHLCREYTLPRNEEKTRAKSWILENTKICQVLRHDQSIPREDDGAVSFDDVLEEFKKKKFDGAVQWSFDDWISFLVKGGGPRKRFQNCLNPNSSRNFL